MLDKGEYERQGREWLREVPRKPEESELKRQLSADAKRLMQVPRALTME